MHALLGTFASILLVVALASAADERAHPVQGQATHEDGSTLPKEPKSKDEHHNTQGEKMKACNQQASAKNLHGDERRHFMSECLKADKKS